MPRTPLEAYAFDAPFGKLSVFILDPRLISVTDIVLSWSETEILKILVSLGTGRTFAVFQILGTCWETKETFTICVITGVSSRAYSFQNQKGRSSGQVAVLFTCANALKTDIS